MPGSFLFAIWFALVRFLNNLFRKSRPVPSQGPTLTSVRVVKEPSPLKRPLSAARRDLFHPPPSPFSNMSLSGLFATPPQPDIQLPGSPSPYRGPPGVPSPSIHTVHSRSPRTPSSLVWVRADRSVRSPTTMSDGSLEVISLGDPPLIMASPTDIGPLPSPWSPVGKPAHSNVWMSVDGVLMNAAGPVVDDIPILSFSRISTASLYSSSSALDAFGISVLASFDQTNTVDSKDVPQPNPIQLSGPNRPTPVTPRKRRDTLPSVTSHATFHSTRSVKCRSTPLTKLDNIDVNHVRSESFSSMAYELRMGLFADGRSITAFGNLISLLDQASPESTRTTSHDAIQPVVAS